MTEPIGLHPPNARDVAELPSDLVTMEAYLRETFPDVDPTPERRVIIGAFVNVLRAARHYRPTP